MTTTHRDDLQEMADAIERQHPAIRAEVIDTGGACLAIRVDAIGNEPKHVLVTDDGPPSGWLLAFYPAEGECDESTMFTLRDDETGDVPTMAVSCLAIYGGMQGV